MNFGPFIDALALPDNARVDQRVPKKLLLEQGAAAPGDKRLIQNGVEEMYWVAALKPTNIGVPAFKDQVREYLEIAVIKVALREAAKPSRLIELIHRAIPYPVVLLASHLGSVTLSAAHKRWSQGEKGKVVVEDVRRTSPLQTHASEPLTSSLLQSLALSGLPRQDMFALYQGWLDRVIAFQAAGITGAFIPPGTPSRSAVLCDGLDSYNRLQQDIYLLRAQAEKETQIDRRVTINLEIKSLEASMKAVEENLRGGND